MGPAHQPITWEAPVQARAMDKADIRDLPQLASRRRTARPQGRLDIVYCYAGHNIALPCISCRSGATSVPTSMAQPRKPRPAAARDHRGYQGGGGRQLRRRRAARRRRALGDDGITSASEGREIVAMLAELPDLWDVNVSDWHNDSVTSASPTRAIRKAHRLREEADHETRGGRRPLHLADAWCRRSGAASST